MTFFGPNDGLTKIDGSLKNGCEGEFVSVRSLLRSFIVVFIE